MTTNVNVNAAEGSREGVYAPRDMTGRSTVAGLFQDRADAEAAITALKDAGFSADEVGVAMRDRTAQGELMEDTGSKAAEGATSGALGGGLLGGVVGFLVGLGALAIPGIGPVVAGGALASAFGLAGGTAVAGAGIGAAAGGLIGALVGMGIPEDEAKHFEAGFRQGGALVTVRAGDRTMDALAILERYGADTGPGSVGASGAMATAGSGTHERHTGKGETTLGAVAGGLTGAAAGAAIGSMVAPGPGTVAGAAIGSATAAATGTATGAAIGAGAGALGGAAAGKGIHEARPADHEDKAAEGSAGGGLAGAAAGAAIGTVVAGPGAGTVAGAAIGGAAGAASGGTAGAAKDDDDEGDRVKSTSTPR